MQTLLLSFSGFISKGFLISSLWTVNFNFKFRFLSNSIRMFEKRQGTKREKERERERPITTTTQRTTVLNKSQVKQFIEVKIDKFISRKTQICSERRVVLHTHTHTHTPFTHLLSFKIDVVIVTCDLWMLMRTSLESNFVSCLLFYRLSERGRKGRPNGKSIECRSNLTFWQTTVSHHIVGTKNKNRLKWKIYSVKSISTPEIERECVCVRMEECVQAKDGSMSKGRMISSSSSLRLAVSQIACMCLCLYVCDVFWMWARDGVSFGFQPESISVRYDIAVFILSGRRSIWSVERQREKESRWMMVGGVCVSKSCLGNLRKSTSFLSINNSCRPIRIYHLLVSNAGKTHLHAIAFGTQHFIQFVFDYLIPFLFSFSFFLRATFYVT